MEILKEDKLIETTEIQDDGILSNELLDRSEIVISNKDREAVTQKVLNWNRFSHGNVTFESDYKNAFNEQDPNKTLIAKYKIAQILIEDGRYKDSKNLVKDFIPKIENLDPKDLALAKHLKGELNLLLIQTGEISVTSPEAKDAEDHLIDKFSEKIKKYIQADMPIEVISHLATVEQFSSITDEKKLEELRSWVSHTFLRPYLGILSGTQPDRQVEVIDLMDIIPRQVFTHPYTVRYNLLENYFASKLMQEITDIGLEEGIPALEKAVSGIEDPDKKEFMDRIYDRFYDVATYPFEGNFKEFILVKDKEKKFPSFEQRTFCYDFIHRSTRLLTADAGLGKTAAAYLALENSKASKVLVIVPAQGRDVWEEQEKVVFQNPGQVFVITGSADLQKAAESDKKYIVISKQLLSRAEQETDLDTSLKDLINFAGIDGAIIDEIHNFSNPKTSSLRVTKTLLEMIRKNYIQKTGQIDTPIIGLTATPIRSSITDLNGPMALLYPEKYALTVRESTATKKTFSNNCLTNPHVAYVALTGEKRMFRWESATGVQNFGYETLPVEISPFEQFLCEFINSEIGGDPLNKIRLMENAIFNPLLVKAEISRVLAKGKIPEIDIDNVLGNLKTIISEWKKLRGVDIPNNLDDYLNADRLVELGLGEMVLGCFFSEVLENGIDTLVEEFTKDNNDPILKDLNLFWRSREISMKYRTLQTELEKSLSWQQLEDNKLGREKVIIISPARKQGRTGDVLQKYIKDEDGEIIQLYTDPELAAINDVKLASYIQEWMGEKGLCRPEDILLIDGDVTVGNRRNTIISKFINDPNAAVLLVTLEAAYQSRDFTINSLFDELGRKIIGIHNIFLGPTWDFRELRQMVGRSLRQEHLVPVRNTILEATGYVDQGKNEGVRFSWLLSRIAISGARLYPEDQEFFDSKRVGARILRYRTPEAQFLRNVFAAVKGAGVEKVRDFLETTEIGQEKTNAQRLAERFYDEGRDAYKTTGYNAEMVTHLIKKFGKGDGKILSLGAGTLLLQRKLKRGIDNIDDNHYMMDEGWKEAQEFGGRKIQAEASTLDQNQFPDSSYDFVDSAFALDWSDLGDKKNNDVEHSERVRILSEVNRVSKNEGMFVLTLPEINFDDNKFMRFIATLELNFGFKIDWDHTGKSFGVNKFGTRKRLGWCISAQKVSGVDLAGLRLQNLEFCTDSREWVSDYVDKKGGIFIPPASYPTPDIKLQFDHYNIVDPTTGRIRVSVSADDKEDMVDRNNGWNGNGKSQETEGKQLTVIDLDFLKGDHKNREDYESYRSRLLRPLIKMTELNWQEAEYYGITLLQEIIQSSRLPKNRYEAYKWILKEAKNRQENNHGRR